MTNKIEVWKYTTIHVQVFCLVFDAAVFLNDVMGELKCNLLIRSTVLMKGNCRHCRLKIYEMIGGRQVLNDFGKPLPFDDCLWTLDPSRFNLNELTFCSGPTNLFAVFITRFQTDVFRAE